MKATCIKPVEVRSSIIPEGEIVSFYHDDDKNTIIVKTLEEEQRGDFGSIFNKIEFFFHFDPEDKILTPMNCVEFEMVLCNYEFPESILLPTESDKFRYLYIFINNKDKIAITMNKENSNVYVSYGGYQEEYSNYFDALGGIRSKKAGMKIWSAIDRAIESSKSMFGPLVSNFDRKTVKAELISSVRYDNIMNLLNEIILYKGAQEIPLLIRGKSHVKYQDVAHEALVLRRIIIDERDRNPNQITEDFDNLFSYVESECYRKSINYVVSLTHDTLPEDNIDILTIWQILLSLCSSNLGWWITIHLIFRIHGKESEIKRCEQKLTSFYFYTIVVL